MRSLVLGCVAVVAVAAVGCKHSKMEAPPLRVAAAADLAFAFQTLGKDFEKQTGQPISFTFGSTGLLEKQIAEGAPYDVFAAANASFVDDAIKSGACDGATRKGYARGRIVVWMKKDAPAPLPKSLADLAGPRFTHIAIANPAHAPYGQAAVEALTSAKIYDAVKPRLVFGENVQQTLEFAETGNAEAAIVALSLGTVSGGQYYTIPDTLHRPIDQQLVICHGKAGAAARRFVAFVASPAGRTVMRRYGFLLPGESLSKVP